METFIKLAFELCQIAIVTGHRAAINLAIERERERIVKFLREEKGYDASGFLKEEDERIAQEKKAKESNDD